MNWQQTESIKGKRIGTRASTSLVHKRSVAEEEERKSCSVLRGEKGDDGVSDGLGEREGEDNAQNGERPRTLVISHTVMRKRGRGKWRGKEESSSGHI